MACGCIKTNKALDTAVKCAQIEADADKKTCIVFKLNGKIYNSSFDCWLKGEDKGDILLLVHPK